MNDLNYNAITETLNATDQQYLVINHPVTQKPIKIKIATFIDIFGANLVISASNGLSIVGNATELGGTLTKNTTINTSTFELIFSSIATGVAGTDDILVINGSDQIRRITANSIKGWGLTGNSGTTAGTNFVGTTDNIDVVFKRNSTEKIRIGTSSVLIQDNLGVGNPTIGARLHVKGAGGSPTVVIIEDSSATELFNIKATGEININGGNGTSSNFALHQTAANAVGTGKIMDVYNNSYGKLLFRITDNGSTGVVSIGDTVLQVNPYGGVGINITGPTGASGGKLRVNCDTLGGVDAIGFTGFGSGGFYVADTANDIKIYMQNAAATTKVQIHSNGDSFLNGGKVSMTALPTSNAGLSTGDMYVSTAATILANGDKIVGWKV